METTFNDDTLANLCFNILAVDDDLTDLELIRRSLVKQKVLQHNSFEITTCNSSQKALELINNNKFDLVLLDCIMPDIDGYELCKNIISLFPSLPVIIVTGLNDALSLQKAFESGAADYITKPIVDIELVMRIYNILKLKASEKKTSKLYKKVLKDLDFASNIQKCMIPDWCYIDRNILFSSFYKPLDKISGDLFDIIRISKKKYCFYVGDISGHGIQTALLMSALHTLIKVYVEENMHDLKINHILNTLNSMISDKFNDINYMTILIGIIDMEKNLVEYLVAGHPSLICYDSKTRTSSILKDKGALPVGLLSDVVYSENDIDRINISKGISLFLFTDGLIEANKKDNCFLTLEGLNRIISSSGLEAGCILDFQEKVLASVKEEGYSFNDDATIICFQFVDKNLAFYYKTKPILKNVIPLIKKIAANITPFVDTLTVAKVEVVVTEIVNNIIIHGFMDTKQFSDIILITLEIEDDSILIKFWDHGIEWEPHKPQIEPEIKDLPVDIQSISSSGRGVDIIYTLTSDFSVRRHGQLNETTVKIDYSQNILDVVAMRR